jgi:hypothetical protein
MDSSAMTLGAGRSPADEVFEPLLGQVADRILEEQQRKHRQDYCAHQSRATS